MCKLKATYKIVTPMFLGGADQSPADDIRPPSVKGALRFWWRALNWGRFWEASENEEKALQNLHDEEARLFGAAMGGKEGIGGQGCFLLSVRTEKLNTTDKDIVHQQFNKNTASRYLGYGLMEAFGSNKTGIEAGHLNRGCINEEQYFDLTLIFKKEIEPSIKEAVIALGLLGGLGSRNRHGFGSLSLENLIEDDTSVWTKAEDKATYSKQLNDLLANKLSAKNPSPFTCFDNNSRIEILNTSNSYIKALDDFGIALQMYRSWGNKGLVLSKKSEKNFIDDHDWSKRDKRLAVDFHPQRAVFGLPHNYGKYKDQSVTHESGERRSSPILLHIHRLHEKSFICVCVFLPTLFLPHGERINAGGKLVTSKINYDVITRFLDGSDAQQIKRFPKKELILKGSEA